MFDFDDMLYSFSIALVIVCIAAGALGSVYLASQYGGDNSRILAVLTAGVWVFVVFRVVRYFRIQAMRQEIRRKEYFIEHLPVHDPDRQKLVARRNEVARKLDAYLK